MKKHLIILVMFAGAFTAYGQQTDKTDKKVPEKRLATDPVNTPKNDKKPELKLVDPSTAKEEKVRKTPPGKPELKLISK